VGLAPGVGLIQIMISTDALAGLMWIKFAAAGGGEHVARS
jgi:hypothetical protein